MTVRVVTIITLIYLPTQFVAVCSSPVFCQLLALSNHVFLADIFWSELCLISTRQAYDTAGKEFLDIPCDRYTPDFVDIDYMAACKPEEAASKSKGKGCIRRVAVML